MASSTPNVMPGDSNSARRHQPEIDLAVLDRVLRADTGEAAMEVRDY